jgi:hypothetical protein
MPVQNMDSSDDDEADCDHLKQRTGMPVHFDDCNGLTKDCHATDSDSESTERRITTANYDCIKGLGKDDCNYSTGENTESSSSETQTDHTTAAEADIGDHHHHVCASTKDDDDSKDSTTMSLICKRLLLTNYVEMEEEPEDENTAACMDDDLISTMANDDDVDCNYSAMMSDNEADDDDYDDGESNSGFYSESMILTKSFSLAKSIQRSGSAEDISARSNITRYSFNQPDEDVDDEEGNTGFCPAPSIQRSDTYEVNSALCNQQFDANFQSSSLHSDDIHSINSCTSGDKPNAGASTAAGQSAMGAVACMKTNLSVQKYIDSNDDETDYDQLKQRTGMTVVDGSGEKVSNLKNVMDDFLPADHLPTNQQQIYGIKCQRFFTVRKN